MPLYDYVCECGVVTEARRGMDISTIPCPSCEGEAKRSAVHSIAIACEGLPTRAGIMAHQRKYNVSEFQEAQHEVIYDQERGRLPKRDLYQIAKQRARKLAAAGIKDVREVRH